MLQPNDPYALLLAKLHALEQELAVLREELADLRVTLARIEAGDRECLWTWQRMVEKTELVWQR